MEFNEFYEKFKQTFFLIDMEESEEIDNDMTTNAENYTRGLQFLTKARQKFEEEYLYRV